MNYDPWPHSTQNQFLKLRIPLYVLVGLIRGELANLKVCAYTGEQNTENCWYIFTYRWGFESIIWGFLWSKTKRAVDRAATGTDRCIIKECLKHRWSLSSILQTLISGRLPKWYVHISVSRSDGKKLSCLRHVFFFFLKSFRIVPWNRWRLFSSKIPLHHAWLHD
jgi:hypothetical protein